MTKIKALVIAAGICAATVFASSSAEAGIPIPCTGDIIIKLADLPAQTQKDGRHFDLGYKFSHCVSGEFIGYLGNDRQYVKFPEAAQSDLRAKGLQAPGFWASAWANKWAFGAEWSWLLFWGLVGCVAIKNKLVFGTFTHPKVIAQREAAAAAKAASAESVGSPSPQRSTSTARATPSATRMARVLPAGATSGFGKR